MNDTEHAPTGGGRHHTVIEGIAVAVFGVTLAALVPLGADLARGLPLETPANLGAHLTRAFGSAGARTAGRLATIFLALHFAAFALAGLLGAALVHRLHTGRRVAALIGMTLVIGGCVAAFVAVVGTGAVSAAAWNRLVLGESLGVAAMGVLVWRGHPRALPGAPSTEGADGRVQVPRRRRGEVGVPARSAR